MLAIISALGLEAQQWGHDNQTLTVWPGRKTGFATPSVFEVGSHAVADFAVCVYTTCAVCTHSKRNSVLVLLLMRASAVLCMQLGGPGFQQTYTLSKTV